MIKLSKEWAKKLKIKTPKIKRSKPKIKIKKLKIPGEKPDKKAENHLWLQLQSLSGWQREYKFYPTRKWMFDFAHVEKKVAVEVEGGIYTNGRHVRPKGFIDDMEKYNEAAKLGWTLMRFAPEQVFNLYAIGNITGYMNDRNANDVSI